MFRNFAGWLLKLSSLELTVVGIFTPWKAYIKSGFLDSWFTSIAPGVDLCRSLMSCSIQESFLWPFSYMVIILLFNTTSYFLILPGMGCSLPYKPTHLIAVMRHGGVEVCFPANGPHPLELALMTAPEPFSVRPSPPGDISPLDPHIRSQLEVQSLEPH